MASEQSTVSDADRKRLGAWYTPPLLIDLVVDAVIDRLQQRYGSAWPSTMTIIDPACGDGRFLIALARRLTGVGPVTGGIAVRAIGCDVDPAALAAIDVTALGGSVRFERVEADALSYDWGAPDGALDADVVIGNPPFLSQMAATTTRGGASRHGGGPYADAAVEFLALSHRLARDDGGLVALVLPQSILAARDGAPVRQAIDAQSELVWSWWERSQRHFDASVNVCALLHERGTINSRRDAGMWSSVVTSRLGVPPLDTSPDGALLTDGTVADRAHLNANFRDEYYALVDAVVEDDGHNARPPLVTSGLIDPGRCWWGTRPVRFAKQTWTAPVVDVQRLTGRFPAWAARKLVPKVLVANQTSIIEAVADPDGAWLPGVPVTTVTPADTDDVWPIAAVLTSPVASAAAWHRVAGTGLSTRSIRIGPDAIGSVPWPAGDLTAAVAALRDGRVHECGRLVQSAYGIDDEDLFRWWLDLMPR